jgi:hypothetical protein
MKPGPTLAAPFGHVLASALARTPAIASPPPAAVKGAIAKPGTPVPKEHAPVEGHPHGKPARDHEHDDEAPKRERAALDPLDPAARNPVLMAPAFAVGTPAAAAEAAEAPRAKMSMEELLPQLVRRIAWAGDRHRGTVRLEIGAGAYAGTTLLVHADAGRVRVEVSGAEGKDLDQLRARLDARLRGHGLDVESVA